MSTSTGGKKRAFSVRYRTTQPRKAKTDFKTLIVRPLNYLMVKSTTACPCSRDRRDGRPKGSEQRFLVEDYPCPSSIPYQQPLLMARETKAAMDTQWGQAAPAPFSWLKPHHGSPEPSASDLARPAASRGGGRAGPIMVMSKTSPFLTCKIDRSGRNISLSS